MTMDWVDIVGWIGAGLVLIAYGLVSTKRLEGNSATYQTLNVLGAVAMLVNTYVRGALPSAAVNVIWIGLGSYILLRIAIGARPTA
jgi:hypothetical protein